MFTDLVIAGIGGKLPFGKIVLAAVRTDMDDSGNIGEVVAEIDCCQN